MAKMSDKLVFESRPQDNVLMEAAQITSVDRQRYYGHPLDNHGCTAELWDVYLDRRRSACEERGEVFILDARDVCWLNTLQKASRDANQRKRDNLVDGCGYLRNAEMVEQEEQRRNDLLVVEDHGLRGPDGQFHRLNEISTSDFDEHDHGRPDGYADGF